MKKLILIIISVCCISFSINAQQKFAYMDTEYILKHIPEYRSAQNQLDDLSKTWQLETEKKFTDLDNLKKTLQAELILLSDEMTKRREQEINEKEKSARDFQKQKFGYDGELNKKRIELIKPIQDRIFEATQRFAEEKNYGVIFDKGGELIMMYSNPKLDVSDDIIVKLGYKPGEIISENPSQKSNSKKNK